MNSQKICVRRHVSCLALHTMVHPFWVNHGMHGERVGQFPIICIRFTYMLQSIYMLAKYVCSMFEELIYQPGFLIFSEALKCTSFRKNNVA